MRRRAPVVRDFEIRPVTFPDGHWMNSYWGYLVKTLCWCLRHCAFIRYFVRAAPETRALLKAGTPVVFACTHQDLPDTFNGLSRVIKGRHMVAMTSTSRDGGIAASVAQALGFEVVRGSTARRGAEALVQMRNRVRAGASAVFAVDGPKPPLGDVKPGIVILARGAKVPIVPVRTWGAERLCAERSWMKMCLTVPAFPAAIFMGPPIYPYDFDNVRDCQIAISAAIADLARKASVWAGGPPVAPFKVAEK